MLAETAGSAQVPLFSQRGKQRTPKLENERISYLSQKINKLSALKKSYVRISLLSKSSQSIDSTSKINKKEIEL